MYRKWFDNRNIRHYGKTDNICRCRYEVSFSAP